MLPNIIGNMLIIIKEAGEYSQNCPAVQIELVETAMPLTDFGQKPYQIWFLLLLKD